MLHSFHLERPTVQERSMKIIAMEIRLHSGLVSPPVTEALCVKPQPALKSAKPRLPRSCASVGAQFWVLMISPAKTGGEHKIVLHEAHWATHR